IALRVRRVAGRDAEIALLCSTSGTLRESQVWRRHEERTGIPALVEWLRNPRRVCTRVVGHADHEWRHLVPGAERVDLIHPRVERPVVRVGDIVVIRGDA